ncbi:NAD(P)-binding domain-containing protein [Alkalihalobacillus oceani]|uniref:NAD(P)-binding domain-containing protein n=1 Tax=Halalkalibacter oceani TaxID=1653776 RepID=UPI00203F482E|nr:NAD(P)-binding domain-containing protein [Halalkalibacter oceani]MCM3761748.1 NAD(P)-binding domain-containing protein [Halalkalibacter oceani]
MKIEIPLSNSCCEPIKQPLSEERTIQPDPPLPIAIIGAGPVGLAAAAHLADRGQPFLVFEAGSNIGHHVLQWGHVRLFSPWRYNIDKISAQLLSRHGWRAPDKDALPLGKELVEDYLRPLAALPEIKPYLYLDTRVTAISKQNSDKMKNAKRGQSPFVIYSENKQGRTKRYHAKAVIDATGTWGQPNPAYADQVWTKEERTLSSHLAYGIPDVTGKDEKRYRGKRIAIVGSGHSALNVLLDLAKLKESAPATDIIWLMRKEQVEQAYGGEEKDALQARGELGTRIHQLVDSGLIDVKTSCYIQELKKENGTVTIHALVDKQRTTIGQIDEIIVNAGSRPDFTFLRELRLNIDPVTESIAALAPLIDPNLHSCGTVRPHGERELKQPEENFYIAGMKSYGRAPTFLMATGYEQIRSITAYLCGDINAARQVELDLPETGVCRVTLPVNDSQADCCS